jgi:hypothetical protein
VKLALQALLGQQEKQGQLANRVLQEVTLEIQERLVILVPRELMEPPAIKGRLVIKVLLEVIRVIQVLPALLVLVQQVQLALRA